MMLSFLLGLVLLAGAAAQDGSPTLLGVQYVVIRPLSTENALRAADADQQFVESNSTLFQADPSPSRKLRGDRQLAYCPVLCQGFAPGTCYLVFPWCINRRRMDDLAPETPAYISKNPPSLTEQCNALIEAVKDSTKTAVQGSAAEHLVETAQFTCFEYVVSG
jgi:hypothetical protein